MIHTPVEPFQTDSPQGPAQGTKPNHLSLHMLATLTPLIVHTHQEGDGWGVGGDVTGRADHHSPHLQGQRLYMAMAMTYPVREIQWVHAVQSARSVRRCRKQNIMLDAICW